MSNKELDSQIVHIVDLASLLPSEQADAFFQRLQEQTIRKDKEIAAEEIRTNLNKIIVDLRNLLPNYKTLEADDFCSSDEINVVTTGVNVIDFGEGRKVVIPPGKRIIKREGIYNIHEISLEFDDGFSINMRRSDFPTYGIRIKPDKDPTGNAGGPEDVA